MGLEPEIPVMVIRSPTENSLLNGFINLAIIIIFCGAIYILYKMFKVASKMSATVRQFAGESGAMRQNISTDPLNDNYEESLLPIREPEYYGLPGSRSRFLLYRKDALKIRQFGKPNVFDFGNLHQRSNPPPPPSPGAGPPNLHQHDHDYDLSDDIDNPNYPGSSTGNTSPGGAGDLRFRNDCWGYNGYGCNYGVNNSSMMGNVSQSTRSNNDLNVELPTTKYCGMPRQTTTPSHTAPQYPTGSTRIERSFIDADTALSGASFDYRSSAYQRNVSDWMDIDDRLNVDVGGSGPYQYSYGFPRRR